MRLGSTPEPTLKWPPKASSSPIVELEPSSSDKPLDADTSVSPLLALGLQWLRADRVFRTEKENRDLKEGKGKKRGAKRGEETTDSE